MAKKYVGVETLEALMQIMKDELAKKVSADELGDIESIKETITQIKEIQEQLEGIIGEDGVEKAQEAENSKKLGGIDADQYAKLTDLAEYLKTEDLVSKLEDLEDMDDEEGRKTAAAALVAELLKKVEAAEASITEVDGKVDAVTERVEAIEDFFGFDAEDGEDEGKTLEEKFEEKIKDLVDEEINSKAGADDGLAQLDSNGKVPAEQLPSYVDDVVEFYVEDESDDEDGSDIHYYAYDEEGDTKGEEIEEGERGKIYVDLNSGMSYRWSGSMFIEISSGMVEMTENEVEQIWSKVVAEYAAKEDASDDDQA